MRRAGDSALRLGCPRLEAGHEPPRPTCDVDEALPSAHRPARRFTLTRICALAFALSACAPTPGNTFEPKPDPEPVCVSFSDAAPPPAALGPCVDETLPRAPLAPSRADSGGVEIQQNILIAERGGYALQGDLYLPPRSGVTGALVVVHGGGWLDCANRRDDVALYAQIVAQVLGIPAFNIEYRLAQEGGGYPENVSDVKCGVQWLRAHAAEHGIDPARIGIMGTSAGAHLALMVALTEDRADLDPRCFDVSAEVSLTLSYAGPTNLPAFATSASIAKEAPGYYTAEDCATPVEACVATRACTRCVDASPLAHACSADGDPIVLLQAPDPYDVFVPQVQAEALAAALDKEGANVTLLIPTDADMRAAGCTPAGGSHAADGCMLRASQAIVNPLLVERLGAR